MACKKSRASQIRRKSVHRRLVLPKKGAGTNIENNENNENNENKRRCVTGTISRRILNTLGPYEAKTTLDFFYFRYPLVFVNYMHQIPPTKTTKTSVIGTISRRILNTLEPYIAKTTLDFFYFRYPLVFVNDINKANEDNTNVTVLIDYQGNSMGFRC